MGELQKRINRHYRSTAAIDLNDDDDYLFKEEVELWVEEMRKEFEEMYASYLQQYFREKLKGNDDHPAYDLARFYERWLK